MSRTFAVQDGNVAMGYDGQARVVEGYDKVQQDINNALSHPYDAGRDYGNEMVKGNVLLAERFAIPGIVQREVGAAIARLRRYQSYTPKAYMPDNEKIDRLKSITTHPVSNLGIAYLAVISVVKASAEDVRTVFRISNAHQER